MPERGVPGAKRRDAGIAVQWITSKRAPREQFVRNIQHVVDMRWEGQAAMDPIQLADGLRKTAPPFLFGSDRMQHLGLREPGGALPPDMGARKIDLRSIAGEKIRNVHGLAGDKVLPQRHLRRVCQNFVHVMTRAETQYLKRVLQRSRSCPAKAGADDFKRHVRSLA